MKEQSPLPSLEKLGEGLDRFDGKEALGMLREQGPDSKAASGARMGLELAVGAGVGFAIGLFLDNWLGTSPIFMVICLFFGSAAGFMTLYRTAQSLSGEPTDVTANKGDKTT